MKLVMPGLKREARLRAGVPGIHDLFAAKKEDVDGRVKPGHDGVGASAYRARRDSPSTKASTSATAL